jgi:nucleoside-diphosphate-sugar epimerase
MRLDHRRGGRTVRALVTGAAGFLGTAVVRRLRSEGIIVRALLRPGGRQQTEADETVSGDLQDLEALPQAFEGVDWVVHAGARVSTSGSWEEFEATNLTATGALIRMATAAGTSRILHVSSLSVYAVPNDGAVVREDDPYDDGADERGFYARSKQAADRLAMMAIRDGAPVTVVRPGLLYGPGRVPPLGRRVMRVGPFFVVFASPGYLLPLAYVDNAADAIALALSAERAKGRTYTIVDEHVPQREHLERYRELSGDRGIPFYPPLGIVRAAASAVERSAGLLGRRAPVTRHQVERTLVSATFDVRRATEELGWKPRVSLRDAMHRTLEAQRNPMATEGPAPARSNV